MDTSEPRDPAHRQRLEAAVALILQQEHVRATLTKPEMASMRVVWPHIVDEFITTATLHAPPIPALHRAAAKGLWPQLKVVVLDPVDPHADNAARIEAFAALSLPHFADLSLQRFGQTSPTRELAALATARWPSLRHLSLYIACESPWIGQVDPGEEWTAALAALTAAGMPVQTLDLKRNGWALIDFPLADIAHCFAPTLMRLCLGHPLGERAARLCMGYPLRDQQGAYLVAAAPLPTLKLARLDILSQRSRVLESFGGVGQTPWTGLMTFAAEDCCIQGDLGSLGAAIPSVTDFWLSFLDLGRTWHHSGSLFRGLQATTNLQKVVLKWAPVGVLKSAAGVCLPKLRVLSVRYTKIPDETVMHAAEEGMNALLQADLPALEKLAVSFESFSGSWRQIPDMPNNPWPALKMFSLEGVTVSGAALSLLRQKVLYRVPDVRMGPAAR